MYRCLHLESKREYAVKVMKDGSRRYAALQVSCTIIALCHTLIWQGHLQCSVSQCLTHSMFKPTEPRIGGWGASRCCAAAHTKLLCHRHDVDDIILDHGKPAQCSKHEAHPTQNLVFGESVSLLRWKNAVEEVV